MISAAIFDVDGLLIDSEPLWKAAEIEVFATVDVLLTEELCRQTVGLRVDATVKHWFDRLPWKSKSVHQVQHEITERVVELIRAKARPMAGVEHGITFFEARRIPIGLCSSSPNIVLEAVVEILGLAGRVQVVHSAEEDPVGKPHPAPYLSTARKMDVEPRFCVAFEDSLNGAISAKAAGMKVVAVPSADMKQEHFSFCDATITSLQEFSGHTFRTLDGGRL